MAEKIKIKSILEIMGAPEEHVKKTMNMVIDKLKESPEFKLISDKIADTAKIEDRPFWSIYAEVELEFDSPNLIMGYCLDFMPSSIEILHPLSFNYDKTVMENLWNDVIARLHEYDMMVKNLHAENVIMKKQLSKLGGEPFKPKPSDVVKEDKK